MARMIRTQSLLGERHVRALERAERDTGASRSELVRRAIEDKYGAQRAPLPRSIGIVSRGTIDAAQDEEILERDWGPRRQR